MSRMMKAAVVHAFHQPPALEEVPVPEVPRDRVLVKVAACGVLRVHPIQYLLVGSAISIFFLLLLSLSEHWAFDLSYAVAASSCVVLLTFYGHYLLRGWAAGLAFGAGLATLYGALYVLLQMEQTSLVLGSVLLFAILAGVMVATRRVDWYQLLAGQRAPQSAG